MKETTKVGHKLLILLDSHAILHRAYHALPDFTNAQGEPTGALYGFSVMLLKIIKELKPQYIVAAFDREEKTFREERFSAYKGTRAPIDEALIAQLDRAKELCKALGVPVYEHPGFEADDIIGTVVAQCAGNSPAGAIDIVIASGDMDTLQLVDGERVRVYTLRKGIQDTVLYDEKGVKERYGFGPELLPDYKGLRGDPSDNIPGVRGIGEVSAMALIQNFGSLEDIYAKLEKKNGKEAFIKKGIKERIITLLLEQKDEAFFSKELGTIRRDAPIENGYIKKEWKEGVDVGVARKFFSELGFKSLAPRLDELFAPTQGLLAASPANSSAEEVIDSAVLERVRLAFWVLDSTKGNASVEEIKDHTGVQSFADALPALEREIDETGDVRRVYRDIELPLYPVLREMEKEGIKVDRAFLADLTRDYSKRARDLEKKIHKEAGEEFNVNSPKQLGEILFGKLALGGKKVKKTATGAISTRAGELEKLRGAHPIIEHLLDYREVQKLLSTYLEPIATMLDSGDRLHTHFVQSGAETGRMSSQNPNLQNIPVRSELGLAIRNIFVAEKGYELVSFDYSQIELRVLAILSGDKNLITIFKSDADIHAGVASRVFGVPEKDVDREMRRRAKVINFGIVYGMGVNALQANLGSTRAEAQEFMDRYFKTFPRVASYLDEIVKEATKRGYTETLFGRRRYFPTLRSKIPYVRAAAERMAMNAPIQGSAADFIKLAMIEVAEAFSKKKFGDEARMLLTVHDELVFEIKKSRVEEVCRVIREKMEGVYDGVVRPVAHMKKGKRWGELS